MQLQAAGSGLEQGRRGTAAQQAPHVSMEQRYLFHPSLYIETPQLYLGSKNSETNG